LHVVAFRSFKMQRDMCTYSFARNYVHNLLLKRVENRPMRRGAQ
jgi:hypothetical protein